MKTATTSTVAINVTSTLPVKLIGALRGHFLFLLRKICLVRNLFLNFNSRCLNCLCTTIHDILFYMNMETESKKKMKINKEINHIVDVINIDF